MDYGTEIRIKSDAPKEYRPGQYGVVVGFKGLQQQLIQELPERDTVYTIEYNDGSDMEVPGTYIECLESEG